MDLHARPTSTYDKRQSISNWLGLDYYLIFIFNGDQKRHCAFHYGGTLYADFLNPSEENKKHRCLFSSAMISPLLPPSLMSRPIYFIFQHLLTELSIPTPLVLSILKVFCSTHIFCRSTRLGLHRILYYLLKLPQRHLKFYKFNIIRYKSFRKGKRNEVLSPF